MSESTTNGAARHSRLASLGLSTERNRRAWLWRLVPTLFLCVICVWLFRPPTLQQQAVARVQELGGFLPGQMRTSWFASLIGKILLGARTRFLSSKRVIGFVLEGKRATDVDVALFCAAFPEATSADLSVTPITDAALSEISNLARMQHLALRNTQITDAGLKQLAGLAQLWNLELDYTAVSDGGIQQLKNLTGLMHLSLSGTRITDAGLVQLQQLPGLHSLDLTGTAVTDGGVQKLQAKLPRCTVFR